MLHETHNEIGRERVFAEMLDWIEARLSLPQPTGRRAGSS
jgi:alpha-beta hydrolase superfamily lysophospholipase